MKKMTKFMAPLLTFLMMLNVVVSMLIPGGVQAAGKFTPGAYKGSSDKGFGGNVEVVVTVSDSEIKEIIVADNSETPDIGGTAMTKIADEIVASQSLAVDAISGATVSSDALLAAIVMALTEAGADIDALKDASNKAEVKAEKQDDITTDVVVVGAGGAGLAAALEVVNAGKSVTILEQMPIVGGNTLRATGGMNAAETDVQKELGIEDSVETFYEDTLKGGKNLNDPDLLRTMVENSADAVKWVNDLGAGLTDVSFSGGATNARIHKPKDGSAVGPLIVNVLEKALKEKNVEAMLDTEAKSLITDTDGKVIGVKAVTKDGQEFTVHAKAVILATGGFGANMDMVKEYNSELVGFETTNHPGATGEGIKMAQEIGADVFQMEEIQIHPTTQPGTGKLYTEGLRGDGAILINKDGKRFIDELKTRDVVSKAILEQEGGQAYLVVNQELVDNNASMAKYISQGDAVEGKDLDELAKNLGVDAEQLKKTMEAYNKAQVSGKDEEFGRENMTQNLEKGPYYALAVTPSIHHTMGGLKIDTKTHVLDKSGKPISGLYAAGEVTGGIHGGNRIGGNAVTDIIVFGRIAGQTSAAELK